MSNLNNLNKFEFAPVSLDIQRSRFHMPHTHKTTFTSGRLIPIGLFEVLPSDTFDIDLSSVVRMVTPVVPTMDNAFLDVYAFYVPNRIACAHPKDWEKICGENVNGYWAPVTEATLDNTGNMTDLNGLDIAPDNIGAYYGLPCGNYEFDSSYKVSFLPFVGYRLIWNEWFRDQNTQPPVLSSAVLPDMPCLPVNKLHDYFTSCLPSPQKGAAVTLPLGSIAPVITSNEVHDMGESLKLSSSNISSYSGSRNLYTNDDGNVFEALGYDSSSYEGHSINQSNLYTDLSQAEQQHQDQT